MGRALRAGLAATSSAILVSSFVAQPAEGQEGHSVAVTPDVGLVDGQTVSVTATGYFSVVVPNRPDPPLEVTPSALQCRAGVFPTSAVLPEDDLFTLQSALSESCVLLARFPITQPVTTTIEVVVRTDLVTGSGADLECGAAPGDCVILAAGVVPFPSGIAFGIASVPISFAPPTPASTTDCKNGGWRNLANDDGQAFGNQGQCVSFVVAHTK